MIRTVSGDITGFGGPVLMHEHLQIDLSDRKGPQTVLGPAHEADIAADLGEVVRGHGLVGVVDLSAEGFGRDVSACRRIGAAAGLQVVCATGYYWDPIPESAEQASEDALYSRMVRELTDGMEDTDINKLKEQQNSSIMLLAHEIIGKATQKRCSDIHLEPDASGVTLRYFLHGELLADCVLPGEIPQALVSSYKIIAGLDPNELQKPQDKKIVTRVEEDRVELRITTLPSDHGEMVAISMRFLGQES